MFENKKILILGLARSGFEAAKVLLRRHNDVLINDGKAKELHDQEKIQELEKMGCRFLFGSHPEDLLEQGFDYLIKNPGIQIEHPYVLLANAKGIPVINEVELAYKLLPSDVTLIGITGTNGKTTTTTLTYEILKEAFKERVHLAGNIGYPLCSILDKLKPNDIIVMEVSCQQSENIIDFHPNIALITNYSEAHIDFFKTYANYKKVKAKMFYNQKPNNIAILNASNQEVLDELKDTKGIKKYFSSQTKDAECHVEGDFVYYQNEKILNIQDIKIPGIHNLENILAAIAISKELNVSKKVIQKVVSNFKGVTHRLEYVDTIKGVRYYNDTEATNIKCTQIALSSFFKPIVLILGGMERGQNFDELHEYMKNVKAIIGIGSARERVLAFGQKENIATYITEHLEDGFKQIANLVQEGDIVLLSPASASWDQYKECEERGDAFKKLVNELKKEI